MMSQKAPLTSSTLKPVPDKWIARDGGMVVLDFSPDEIVLLRYSDRAWHVTRHPRSRVQPLTSDTRLHWYGSAYDDQGASVARISDEDPPEKWRSLYSDLLSVAS